MDKLCIMIDLEYDYSKFETIIFEDTDKNRFKEILLYHNKRAKEDLDERLSYSDKELEEYGIDKKNLNLNFYRIDCYMGQQNTKNYTIIFNWIKELKSLINIRIDVSDEDLKEKLNEK